MPFVYAFWAVPAEAKMDRLVNILDSSRRQGLTQIDRIVERFARGHGFDTRQAHKYLTQNISYEFGNCQRQGLCRFYQLAYQLQLIPQPRPLRLYRPSVSTMRPAGCEYPVL